jgi:pimeloyl-ACP methyl ester carboxylesterase
MAKFVLVHGAWQGGYVYARVARRLREAGHDVYTPTLTGLGERSHLADHAINLDAHIQDIVNVFSYEDITDAILCGHSYGGIVITGVANQIGERIRSLFYIDAFAPPMVSPSTRSQARKPLWLSSTRRTPTGV